MYDLLDPLPNFDITSHGVAFAARNIVKGQHVFLASSAWYISVDDFTKPPTASPRQIQVGGRDGAAESVRFSPDGSKIALLFHDDEDWFNAKLLICTPDDLESFDVMKLIVGVAEDDDTDAPEAYHFAGSSDELIIQSSQNGRVILSYLKLEDGAKPRALTKSGSVSAAYPLVEGKWDKLLVTSSNFVDSSIYSIVDVSDPSTIIDNRRTAGFSGTISSATKYGAKFELEWDDMVEEFWYEGADEKNVQCWMIKPMDFDENKKYPWIFLPHGGPQSAWNDAWGTRVRCPPFWSRVGLTDMYEVEYGDVCRERVHRHLAQHHRKLRLRKGVCEE